MEINGKRINLHRRLADFTGEMGTVVLFPLRNDYEKVVLEELTSEPEPKQSRDFANKLFRFICYPKENVPENSTLPEEPIFTVEETSEWPELDLEKLAALYIEKTPELNCELVETVETTAGGGKNYSSEYGDIEHKKRDNESFAEYLHRLYWIRKRWLIEQSEVIRENMQKFIHSANFSPTLSEMINDTLESGTRLDKMISDLAMPNFPVKVANHGVGNLWEEPKTSFESIGVQIPRIDIESMERNRRAPFEQLGAQIENLAKTMHGLIGYSKQATETNFGILGEIETSNQINIRNAEDNKGIAQHNQILTYFVIFLSIASLFASSYFGNLHNKQSSQSTEQNAQFFANTSESLGKIGLSDSTVISLSEEISRAIRDEQSNLAGNIVKEISAMLGEQAQLIAELQTQQSEDRETIKELRNKIQNLEQENDSPEP